MRVTQVYELLRRAISTPGVARRLDPHKRSAQLDFLEKILGVHEAYGCPGETAPTKKPKYRRDKGREDGEQKEENETAKEDDLDEERRQEERRREGKGGKGDQ